MNLVDFDERIINLIKRLNITPITIMIKALIIDL
jgi:predicted methyltransferase